MTWRPYKTLRALRAGEVVDLDGIKLKMDVDEKGEEKDIQPGDLYIAERNTGPHLLTAKVVVRCKCSDDCKDIDFIHPTSIAYSFDGSECVKVVEAT